MKHRIALLILALAVPAMAQTTTPLTLTVTITAIAAGQSKLTVQGQTGALFAWLAANDPACKLSPNGGFSCAPASGGGVGPIGPAGPAGAKGAQGPIGPQGPTGINGETGPQGSTGPAGATGAAGQQGLTGPQGLTGATGTAGSQGAQGIAGPPGQQGPAGAQGAVGPQGPAGAVAGGNNLPSLTETPTRLVAVKPFFVDTPNLPAGFMAAPTPAQLAACDALQPAPGISFQCISAQGCLRHSYNGKPAVCVQ